MIEDQSAILQDVNSAQREAIIHRDGPLLVVAGAGSGKTRVITRRMAYLMSQGVHPASMLAITFTNKAAAEMRHRVTSMVGHEKVWVSTFHSFGARVLRIDGEEIGLDSRFSIYDADDQSGLIKASIKKVGLDPAHFRPQAIRSAISQFKNDCQDPLEAAESADGYFLRQAAKVYGIYQQGLRDANALDFDDLLLETLRLLEGPGERSQRWRTRFDYVLIDEYQDTNAVQYRLAKALTPSGNLCATGDPDQSIYSWRGADIRNILDFERDFPGAKIVRLELNYRSSGRILSCASHVISHNRLRKDRDLYTEGPDGEPVRVIKCANESMEADAVLQLIKELVSEGVALGEIAIFYRTNALSRSLEKSFRNIDIPYQIIGGVEFYSRREVRDLLAYLRLINNPRDTQSFQRVINVPARGIGATTLQKFHAAASSVAVSVGEFLMGDYPLEGFKGRSLKALQGARGLFRQLTEIPRSKVAPFFRQLVEDIGYVDYLVQTEGAESQERIENIRELEASIHEFDRRTEDGDLATYLSETALVQDSDAYAPDQDCVTLMTLHSAKGLEFPHVFLIGMEEGMLPHERSLNSEGGLEEERRLCYVGITRAMQRLTLLHSSVRWRYGGSDWQERSRFIDELPQDEIEWTEVGRANMGYRPPTQSWDNVVEEPAAEMEPEIPFEVGELVVHHKFGEGTVVDIKGSGGHARVTVRFPNAGQRTLLQEHARLRRA